MRLLLILAIVLCVGNSLFSQTLFINEIIADNQAGQMDDFFERDDWVEIYNTGGITNLAGYYISDDPLDLTKWQIPSTNAGVTTILPNDHLILWVDRDPEQGEDHADFSLNIDGETFLLVDPDGTTIIDSISYPQLAPDISYGRVCDGCTGWQYFNNVTFNDDNMELAQAPQLLFVNEVQTQNISTIDDLQLEFEPWLEIYNPNNFQVNLAGYYLGLNGDPLQWQFPGNDPYRTVIPANGFKLVWCDGEDTEGTLHTNFELPVSGGTVVLTAADGTTQTNSYTFGAVEPDQSYGRQSDGSATSITFPSPTPGVTNSLIFIVPPTLYINEVLASNVNDVPDNMGDQEDWIEIYNPNDFDVNLSGYYLTDNPENPMKWTIPNSFPDSVTVPAGEWILFWADEDQMQGVLHTSFRLNNTAEYVGLYSPDGLSLADEIYWQGLDADTSYGRLTDGGLPWVLFTGTTPDASNAGGTVSVQEMSAEDGLTVYPNPTSEYLLLSRVSNVTVYSLSGQVIYRGERVRRLDTRDWTPGCYLLRTDSGSTFRIIR